MSGSTSAKSMRSRMGGVMRRTSSSPSVLAVSIPVSVPSVRRTTPVSARSSSSLPRRSSISRSLDGRKSTSSLELPGPPPAPAPALIPIDAPAPEAESPIPDATPALESPTVVKRLLPLAAQYQMYPSPIAPSSSVPEPEPVPGPAPEPVADPQEQGQDEEQGPFVDPPARMDMRGASAQREDHAASGSGPIAVGDTDVDRARDDGGSGISSIPMPMPIRPLGLPPTETFSDERRPLLSRHPTPTYHSTDGAPAPTSFADRGWVEYTQPDAGSTRAYYVHPMLRVTSDAALRVPAVLEDVAWVLGAAGGAGPSGHCPGLDLWLRDENDAQTTATAQGTAPAARRLVRWWVNHATREVSSAEAGAGLEDHLDMEYRYWAFMEGHPAHASLPPMARLEAIDVLTGAWTDHLLSSQDDDHHQSLSASFTQSECQELLALLRSLNDDAVQDTDAGMHRIVLTRAVSLILLRVVQWRQHHFRPHKPLPTDVVWPHHNHLQRPPPAPRRVRAAAAALASLLLLGVPALFSHRARPGPPDAAATRHALPPLLAGALASLLAAGLLSAATTLLAAPGLGAGARRAALAAGVLAAGAMAAGPVAILRYRAAPAGRSPLSARSVVWALPLVLLIYALGAFGAAVVLHAFRGAS